MIEKILDLFKPLEKTAVDYYDKNYLFYAVLGGILLIIALIVYLIFFNK